MLIKLLANIEGASEKYDNERGYKRKLATRLWPLSMARGTVNVNGY